mgnify:CR=1 FL=1
MEAAGQGLAAQAIRMLDSMDKKRGPIWILCGPGNNGGDGFAAALGLIEEGVDVRLLATHLIQRGAAAQDYRERCSAANIPLSIWPEVQSTIGTGHPALIVDCLVGAGPGHAGVRLRGDVASVRNWLAESRGRYAPVLACDMPTGLGGPDVIKATATVTYHAEKWALRDTNGKVQPDVGEIHTANLPWPARVEDCGPGDARRHPPIRADARKGDRGRLLIVGGGPYHGAPILSAMGALRVGCDLVHVAMPSLASQRVEWPVDVIPEDIPDVGLFSTLSLDVIENRMSSGRGVQAILIGPGLGKMESTKSAVQCVLGLCIKYFSSSPIEKIFELYNIGNADSKPTTPLAASLKFTSFVLLG